MNHIELFAGAGGLNLGLQCEGYNLVLANELSPMASETFSYNFFNTPLEENDNALWISSNYPRTEISKRLREDTRTYPNNYKNSDITDQIYNKLLIGNLIHLNLLLEAKPDLLSQLTNDLDLVSGGPPCQSFSMAGLRQLDNHRNTLPWEFAKFVNLTRPRFVLLENVSGIIKPFNYNGEQYYAWKEVAKAFAGINYVPVCIHINTKYIGIPQNRPRFLMIGIDLDVYKKMHFNEKEKILMKPFIDFIEGKVDDINIYYDIEKNKDMFIDTFLSYFISDERTNVMDAISDLIGGDKSDYVEKINDIFNVTEQYIENHEYRNNSDIVKGRFRIYQIMNELSNPYKKQLKSFIKGESLTTDCLDYLLQFKYYLNGSLTIINNREQLFNYLIQYRTNKQSQKALCPDEPSPTIMSIADDVCHYDINNLRTLTVREMARLQSFPDSFVFKSKVTTGGKMRQFEVPQYTQVGNAIPPLLGIVIGKMFKYLKSIIS